MEARASFFLSAKVVRVSRKSYARSSLQYPRTRPGSIAIRPEGVIEGVCVRHNATQPPHNQRTQ